MRKFVKKFVVADITKLTDNLINKLECGDLVVKEESGNCHAYVVSYKEENTGICLTYTDCENVETVAYDYTNKHWVFNSKDVTPIGQ